MSTKEQAGAGRVSKMTSRSDATVLGRKNKPPKGCATLGIYCIFLPVRLASTIQRSSVSLSMDIENFVLEKI